MSESKKRPLDVEKKKARKRRKSSARQGEEDLMDMEAGINTAFAFMDGPLLSDYLAQRITRHGSDLSSVERTDLTVSANCIVNTTSWQQPRTTESLPDFLEKFADGPESLKACAKKPGSPHTIVVAGAGLRAADLVRALRKLQPGKGIVAKLFAKHFKVQEQVEVLNKSRTSIGVGTPQRLMDLLDTGALKTNKLERIVVDASHIDQKKRGILDMRETLLPLAHFLARKEFTDRYGDSEKPLALLFY